MSHVPVVLLRCLVLLLAVLLPALWPEGLARPDLVVLAVAAAALLHRPSTGLLVGLAGGWLLDLVPPGATPMGASALTYAAVGYLLGLGRHVVAASPVLPWVATALGAAAVLAVRGITAAAGAGHVVAGELGWSLAMTLLVAVPVLPLLMGLERRTRDRGPR